MKKRHATFAAIIVASMPASALASECRIEPSESRRQADKLKMTVLNLSSRDMSANIFNSGESDTSILNRSNRLEMRTFELPQVWARGSDSISESGDHGFELEFAPGEHPNHGGPEILTVRFKVINSRSISEDGRSSLNTRIVNTDYKEWHQFRHFTVKCSARYYDRIHSYWHYKITIEDK